VGCVPVVVFWVVTLKVEAAKFFEKFVSCHFPRRCHNAQDQNLNVHRRENLKFRLGICCTSVGDEKCIQNFSRKI
jgi:hypothetical protein